MRSALHEALYRAARTPLAVWAHLAMMDPNEALALFKVGGQSQMTPDIRVCEKSRNPPLRMALSAEIAISPQSRRSRHNDNRLRAPAHLPLSTG